METRRRHWIVAAVLLAACCLPRALQAQDEELRQRVRELEQRLQQLEGQTDRTGYVSLDGADADEPAGADDGRLSTLERELEEFRERVDEELSAGPVTFQVNGRVHADFWGFPRQSDGIGFFEHPDPGEANFGTDPANRFQFRRIRFETKGDVYDTMLWRIQVDFNNPGTPEMKDVFIGFDELPGNQTFLIGNQKRPLGMDHLNSSRFNVFTERPLVVEAFNEDARRPGMTFYGYTDDESVGWAYGSYLLNNVTRTGRYVGDSSQASINARLWNSPWYDETSGGRGYFHWAVAGMAARPDGDAGPADANLNEARFRTRPEARSTSRWINTGRIPGARWYEIAGVEAALNVGSLHVVSEYQANWLQRDDSTPGTGPDLFFHGAYVHVSYFLTGEHMPYRRTRGTINRVTPFENFFLVERCCGRNGGGWGAWQVAFRYSWLDLTSHDVRGGVEHDYTFGMNWYWTPNSKVQFNLIYGTIDDHRPVGGFTDGDFLIAGTRFMIDF